MSKRKPTDSTLRNVRATAKRDAALHKRIDLLVARVKKLESKK